MSLLFNVSPEDAPDKKRSRGRRQIEPEIPVPALTIRAISVQAEAGVILGPCDGHYPCIDQACQAEAHDIVHEDRNSWYIQCCFCGTAQWVKAIAGHLKPKEQEFVFRDGRCSGLTLAEAWRQPRGRDYIEWAAAEHGRPAVKQACREWLASVGYPSPQEGSA